MKKLVLAVATLALLALLAACAQPPAAEPEGAPEAVMEVAEVVMTLPMTTDSEEAREHVLSGLRASDAGDFNAAKGHFEAAVDTDPEFALAFIGAANNSTSLEGFASNLKQAMERAAGASEAERLYIESVQKGFDNDLEGQLALRESLVALHPESPRALVFLAQAQGNLGRYEAQRETAMKAIEISPGFVPAYATLGNSYLFNEPRDFNRAEEYMGKIVELRPTEQQSHDFMGDVYRAQNELEKARDAYTRAAELDPSNGSALQQRGHVNSFLGNWDQARADYDAAMELSDPDTRASFGTWRSLVSVYEGDPEAAVAELGGLVEAVDGMDVPAPRTAKVNALVNLGTIATHHEMFEAAEEALASCRTLMMEQADEVGTDEFRRGQESFMAYMEGMLAARQGDYATAQAKAEEYMKLVEPDANPRKNEAAHEVLGLANLVQGNHQKAVEHYEQTDPNDVYAQYHLALAHEGAGEEEKAQEIIADVAAYNFNFVGYALIREEAAAKVQ